MEIHSIFTTEVKHNTDLPFTNYVMQRVSSSLIDQYLYTGRRVDLVYGDASHFTAGSPSLIHKSDNKQVRPKSWGGNYECKGNLLELFCTTK